MKFIHTFQRFQSTLPVRGATVKPGYAQVNLEQISIHAPRAGSDRSAAGFVLVPVAFQSTLPVRGATRRRCKAAEKQLFQSTLPVRGATIANTKCNNSPHISIHAPRAGSDLKGSAMPVSPASFQSTLPVRGATIAKGEEEIAKLNFNPRSPCGERLYSALP